ncbi:MAG: hypothetical protein J3Q66DRAFT_347113 [Benniella sp.]|nr:MAG: hypothetical protein J3Q66DRAFT_347113 [Benniella sp.]
MSTQDKGYYGEPPQYPQQAMPAYGQAPYGQAPYGQAASPAPYGQAASYQGGYPPPQQQPYGAPQPAYGAQPVQYQVSPAPAPAPAPQHNSSKDDMCFGCALGACLCCCLDVSVQIVATNLTIPLIISVGSISPCTLFISWSSPLLTSLYSLLHDNL